MLTPSVITYQLHEMVTHGMERTSFSLQVAVPILLWEARNCILFGFFFCLTSSRPQRRLSVRVDCSNKKVVKFTILPQVLAINPPPPQESDILMENLENLGGLQI